MENLQLIAEAMGHKLQKGGQGYEIINRHGLRIFNEPTLYAVAFYLAQLVKNRNLANIHHDIAKERAGL